MTLSVAAPDGVPEVGTGDDLARLLVEALDDPLRDGDVVVVTSKVVSKAEGRVQRVDREAAIEEQTVRVVARRGGTRIVVNPQGLTMAAAGVDASNVGPGFVVLLPEDPDASARGIRARLRDLSGANVGVVVTDTSGRAWREGQTDIAIGAAGIVPLLAYAGRTDGHGNALAVTAPAVADQVAGAAELVQTKLGGRPFAVVRGLEHLVLAPDDDGPGARSLVRAPDADLFGYGAREAVVRAVSGDPAEQPPFGAPAPATELAAVLLDVLGIVTEPDGDGLVVDPAAPRDVRLGVLAFAHGWQVASGDTGECRIRPVTP